VTFKAQGFKSRAHITMDSAQAKKKAAPVSRAWSGEMKWGDAADDEDASPQDQQYVSAPDENGIKTITEYTTNQQGEKVKIVTKMKVSKKRVKVNKNVIRRRQWAKFGACEDAPVGPEKNITYVSHESINLDLSAKKREDQKDDDPLDKLQTKEGGNDSIVVCRHCGEVGHWTLKCPKRGEIVPTGMEAAPTTTAMGIAAAAAQEGSTGKYIPLPLREGGKGASGYNRGEEAGLRVTNLSEDVTEDDLRELFRKFGHTTRTFLARDYKTNQSRGFAFVNYQRHEDAQMAIDKLNGHGYDNLILRVEWAKPREDYEKTEKEVTENILRKQKRQF